VCMQRIICAQKSHAVYVLCTLSEIEYPLPSLEERTKSLGRRRATTIFKQEEEELEPSTMIVQEGSLLLRAVSEKKFFQLLF